MSQNNIDWFEQFLNKLLLGGWGKVFSPHGWDLSIGTSQDKLIINREMPGIEEYTLEGTSAVHPGDPALSLLYHVAMHPGIQPESITFWPSLEDIDALENHIYGLVPPSEDMLGSLVPVVMAYEYRVTRRTPHKKHADLVFSRTGVGRVGTCEPEYSETRRCFNTNPSDGSGGTRVLPARYGVFLCREKLYGDQISIQGKKHSEDSQRFFYEPISKVFDGMNLGEEVLSLKFENHHQNDKLNRIVEKGKLKIDSQYDISKPPFYYTSNREKFTDSWQFPGSLIIWRKPQEMCRIAKQENKIVTFKVPKENLLWLKTLFSKLKISFFYNNRRYTSLRVGQNLILALLDYSLNALISAFGSDKRVFLSPRLAGEFTNIRHLVDKNGKIIDLNLLPVKKFKKTLSEGGYQAVMYEDPISEGYISASFDGISIEMRKLKPAYSLMTAPDFMPWVGNIDIYQYKDNFISGGPRALCEGRLPVNLRLAYGGNSSPVFLPKEQTVTAIIAKARRQTQECKGEREYDSTHYMTDDASDIFAPGWDVTYSKDSLFSPAYYHTAGLGSPFLEDVKLCAAANGMWPAASPDAARTFKRKTRTALPLTDEEIGLSPESSLAKRKNNYAEGWDGEYGPFIQEKNSELVVNYASIERSDYISNYFDSRFNFSQLRKISRLEAAQRLSSLAQVNKILLGKTPLGKSDFWLVSFVKIEAGSKISSILNIPLFIFDNNKLDSGFIDEQKEGYFYIFVKYSHSSIATENPIRRIQTIDEMIFVKIILGENPEVLPYKI